MSDTSGSSRRDFLKSAAVLSGAAALSAIPALHVGTYAAAPDKRGEPTTFNVTNLPDASTVRITVDGQPFTRFTATGASRCGLAPARGIS
jgi:hypothetical protein